MSMIERATTGFLLWRVTMKFRAGVDRVLADLGLTHAQYSLLASLRGMTGGSDARPSQRELADHTGLEPIFVSKLARALEQAGLLTRATSGRDSRAVELALTPQGVETVGIAVERVQGLHQELLAPIGGPGGANDRHLADTLRTLLGAPPATAGTIAEQESPRQVGSRDMTTPAELPPLTGQDLGEAEGAVHGLLETLVAGTEVNADEYVVLRVLTLRPPMTLPELLAFLTSQRQLRRDEEQVDAMLRRLDSAGLLTGLDGAGPVRVTARGEDLHAAVFASVRRISGQVFGGLDPAELAAAKRVLAEVTQRALRLRTELAAA
ncbi:hypothetical protein BL253_06975 [Pseudofrankia asymbiotica]|uniref:HTH marR-type domain-containing protein n=1 Tax=Pseudofrankia asymbiotica TaxID=1834516 RepID=A0A1V2IFE9_9ACTN|nr:hypothetical protein BL253_06975 [Pseudofrankia asymbiotica]